MSNASGRGGAGAPTYAERNVKRGSWGSVCWRVTRADSCDPSNVDITLVALVPTGCGGDAVLGGRVGRVKGEDVVMTVFGGSVVVVDEDSLGDSSGAVKLT